MVNGIKERQPGIKIKLLLLPTGKKNIDEERKEN